MLFACLEQAGGDFDAPGTKAYEDSVQMLLSQQMDEHELLSALLSQGLRSNVFDHSFKSKQKTAESNAANMSKMHEVLAEQLMWPGRSVHTLRSQLGSSKRKLRETNKRRCFLC